MTMCFEFRGSIRTPRGPSTGLLWTAYSIDYIFSQFIHIHYTLPCHFYWSLYIWYHNGKHILRSIFWPILGTRACLTPFWVDNIAWVLYRTLQSIIAPDQRLTPWQNGNLVSNICFGISRSAAGHMHNSLTHDVTVQPRLCSLTTFKVI